MEISLAQHVKELRDVGDLLVKYTFPLADFKLEQEILLLKQRTLMVDGYDIHVCYSKADYGDYILESLQLHSVYAPFLSFAVACKVGRSFLGSSDLSFIEFLRNNRKVYCWTVKTKNGKSIPADKRNKSMTFEDFSFTMLAPGSMDLF